MKKDNDNTELQFKQYDAETIDNIIKNRIDCVKKNVGKTKAWSESELNLRRMVITDLIRQNLSKRRVKEELMDRWGITARTFDNYYKDALDTIIEDNQDLINNARETIIMRLEGVAEACFNNGDMSGSLKALDQLSKIFGLYTEKHEITVDNLKFDFGNEE